LSFGWNASEYLIDVGVNEKRATLVANLEQANQHTAFECGNESSAFENNMVSRAEGGNLWHQGV
jgi:hypothetical protein